MNSIAVHKYNLKPVRSNLNAKSVSGETRSGALLKVHFANKTFGYADLFPWPEFGDSELETQLELIKRNKLTPISERSLRMAETDATMRANGISAFADDVKLKSHFLVQDIRDLNLSEIKNQGFTAIKIKMGAVTDSESLKKIISESDLLLRIDFNSSLNWDSFEKFAKVFSVDERRRFEFIEDPMPWNSTLWKKAAQYFPLAIDFEGPRVPWESMAEVPFRYLVVKPARENPEHLLDRAFEFDCRLVFTHSMDHPVGVMHAALAALEIAKKHNTMIADGGLLYSNIYETTKFACENRGCYFVGASGTGIGFDKVLESLEWQKLI